MRVRVLLILVGAALVAGAALVVTTETRDGKVRSTAVSPDGQYRATAYSRKRAFTFTDRVEVKLSRAGAEVSFGCLVIENDPVIELTFEAGDTALTVDVGGEAQRIRFDPQTLYPSELIGSC